jgi:fatty-acyl-CoA synthase
MYHYVSIALSLMALFNSNLSIVFPAYGLDALAILESVHTYKCNFLTAFPKLLVNTLNHPKRKDFDLSSVGECLVTGQMTPADLILRCRRELNLVHLTTAYGMTEIGFLARNKIQMSHFSPEKYLNSIGEIGPLFECKIVNPETGQAQPHNEAGELHVKGSSVTKSYWNDEDMTRKIIDPTGWYKKLAPISLFILVLAIRYGYVGCYMYFLGVK